MLGGRRRRSVFVEGWGSGGGRVGERNSPTLHLMIVFRSTKAQKLLLLFLIQPDP